MSPGFPRERGAKRAHLLAAVEGIREVVAAGALEAERLGTLPPATVRALAGRPGPEGHDDYWRFGGRLGPRTIYHFARPESSNGYFRFEG